MEVAKIAAVVTSAMNKNATAKTSDKGIAYKEIESIHHQGDVPTAVQYCMYDSQNSIRTGRSKLFKTKIEDGTVQES